MSVNTDLKLSSLSHTWIFDLDGTLVKHNGYLGAGDELLTGVRDFVRSIPENDEIIILTARKESQREDTCLFLDEMGLRYDRIVFDVPHGERILVNDIKPEGLHTAIAVNLERDFGLDGVTWRTDETI